MAEKAKRVAKRILDFTISLLALVLAGPVICGLIVAIRLESKGDGMFKQQRVGLNGRPFEILKLRTMVANAEALGGHSTLAGDPRITRLGRFLRKTSLDELPQLLNVIRGDMSLVGPRPDTPMQESDYSDDQWLQRHRVRPGITGLAQARLRSGASFEQRIALDLEYVERASVIFDIQLIIETARSLIKNRAI